MHELLEILGAGDGDEWEKIAALLAFAGRQPDFAEKFSDDWHQQLDAIGAHPGMRLWEVAIRTGRKIRDEYRFIPQPGSRFDPKIFREDT